MNDLRPNAVFRANAFKPTEEELQAATRRRYPGPSRHDSRNGSAGQSQASRKPPPKAIRIDDSDVELSDSSDEDLPDASEILRNHGSQKEDKSKGKPKGKGKASNDNVSCFRPAMEKLLIGVCRTTAGLRCKTSRVRTRCRSRRETSSRHGRTEARTSSRARRCLPWWTC